MDTISASDAKNRFSTLIDKVQTEPVIISRHGRPVAVVMSAVESETRLNFNRRHPTSRINRRVQTH
jgi:prevent-host-death family protein